MAEEQYVEDHEEHDEKRDPATEPVVEQKPLAKPKFVKVADLKPMDWGFSVYVKVVEVTRKLNRLNLDGSMLRISEAVCGDETGVITMSVRDPLIDLIEEGHSFVLRNAKTEMYQGHMRVAVDRWGLVEEVTDMELAPNTKNDISATEYVLVDPATENQQ